MTNKNQSFWLAALAGFVVLSVGDVVIHRIWLGDLYRELAHFWRPPQELKANAWLPFLSAFSLAFLLAVIFPIGHKGKSPVGEGLRFGILMGLLLYLPSTLMKHYVYPYPPTLLAAWFLGGIVEVTLAGLAISLAYQKGKGKG